MIYDITSRWTYPLGKRGFGGDERREGIERRMRGGREREYLRGGEGEGERGVRKIDVD